MMVHVPVVELDFNRLKVVTLLDDSGQFDIRMLVTGFLLVMLVGSSAVVWRSLIRRWSAGETILEWNGELRSAWYSASELFVVGLTFLWVAISLSSSLAPSSTADREIGRGDVVTGVAIHLGLLLILVLGLKSTGRSWREFGLTMSGANRQIREGIAGFFAAVIPMAISMAVTLPLRSARNQHVLLKLLCEANDVTLIVLIGFTAIVVAPLTEELLYRVVLQGWLESFLPASMAIGMVAFLFSMVHGWRNGLALLPLALILGNVFHRRHSYLSVVVIHALFNATMLTLQLLNPQTASVEHDKEVQALGISQRLVESGAHKQMNLFTRAT